jgi:hypothetical protein
MAEPRTSLHIWKGSIIPSVVVVNILVRFYNRILSGESSLLLFDQLTEKDYYISYKRAVEKSQPKSIGHGANLVMDGGGDDAE